MVFSSDSIPLFEEYKLARAIEGEAITALHAAMKGGLRDENALMELTQRMTDTHNKSMDIWDQLQQFKMGE